MRQHEPDDVGGANRFHHAALAAVIAIGAAVRIAYLFQPIRHDEAWTFNGFAIHPLSYGLSHYRVPNNHLLNTFFVHLSYRLFGGGTWALRLPALLAGVLLIPATYRAARLIAGSDAGLLAAALVASSARLIEFSALARGYAFMALAAAIVVAATARFLREEATRWTWLEFVFAGILGFYAVPVMLYPFGAVVLWAALEIAVDDRRRLIRLAVLGGGVAATLVGTLLLYLPPIRVSGWNALVHNETLARVGWSTFPRAFARFWTGLFGYWHAGSGLVVGLVLLALFVAGTTNRHRRFAWSMGGIAAIWIAEVIVVQRVFPFPRAMTGVLPFYLIGCALGVPRLLPVRRAVFAIPLISLVAAVGLTVGVVASAAIPNSREAGRFDDAPEVVSVLARCLGPTSYVSATGDSLDLNPLAYFMRKRGLSMRAFRPTRDVTEVYFVVNRQYRDSLAGDFAIAQSKFTASLQQPRVVASFPHSSLYVAPIRGTPRCS